MPSRSPQSVSASQTSTSGSGSGMGNPKANFKHALPPQLPDTYFTDIRRRLDDSVHHSSEVRRRRSTAHTASPVYDGEDAIVCQDLIEACRMLESAPMDARLDSSPAGSHPRRQGSVGSLSSRASGTPPTTPYLAASNRRASTRTVTPPANGVALSAGRTSDGLFGLNHYPPQKDLHNGPAQAFLEADLESLAKASVWQKWAESRSKFFDETAPVAAEVFSFACVDETIVSVSPSTPPTCGASSSSRTSPSTPFRRSPRPDYETRMAELQARYVRIGASSFLHAEKALMVHVWRSGKAAQRFYTAWQRCWQALFEHRVSGIHCPVSALFSIQGVTLSVTALPPVYVDKVPPILNAFSPFCNSADVSLTRRSPKMSRSGDDNGCGGQLLSAMLCRLFAALHLPQDDTIFEQYGDVHLYAGVDGRWYLLQIGPMMCHSSPLLQMAGSKYSSPVRLELLREIVLEAQAAGTPYDLSFRGIHKYILHKAIPRAMSNAAALLPQGSPESRKPEVLHRDGFLTMMLHDHGVNMSYLFHVYEYCVKMAAQQIPLNSSMHGGDDEDYVAGVPVDSSHAPRRSSSFGRRHSSSTAPSSSSPSFRRSEAGGDDPANLGQYYQILATTCLMEMLGRTVKMLTKLDVTGGFTTSADFRTSTTVRLDMVNRMARIAASRDQDFLFAHILPALRAKYRCPDTFELGWDTMTTGAVLKILSLHLGAEYGVGEGRFITFAQFAKKKALLMFPVVSVDAMLSGDERRVQRSIAQLWDDANRAVGKPGTADQSHLFHNSGTSFLSPLHMSFVSRAITFSIIARSHRQYIVPYTQLIDATYLRKGWPLQVCLECAYYAAVMEEPRPSERCEQFAQLVTDLLRHSGDGSSASSSITAKEDVGVLSLLMLRVGIVLLRAKRSGATSCIRKSVEAVVTEMPHVDFVFQAHHTQTLRDIESLFSELEPPSIYEHLHGTVETVIAALRRWNRMPNAARYLQRLTAAMINVPLVEESQESVRIAQLSFSTHTTLFGAHDGRTLMALYCMCLFSLCSMKSNSSAVTQGITNMRKVIQKHQALSPALQISFGRTNTVQVLLTKLRTLVDESGDSVTSTSLKVALAHAERYRLAVLLLQSVGRGYSRRRLLSMNGPRTPFSPPQRPSSMVYFDGQLPISLGQAANLGISLEDETTRAGRAANDAHSDTSSITGSFMSGSSAKPHRFASRSFTGDSSAMMERTPFHVLSPTRDDPNELSRNSMSVGVTAQPSVRDDPSLALRLYRPVPREATASVNVGSPQPELPAGAVPDKVIQRVLAYQQQPTPRGSGKPPSPSNAQAVAALDSMTPLSATVVHRGKTVANAWNFDVSYKLNDDDDGDMVGRVGMASPPIRSSAKGPADGLSRSLEERSGGSIISATSMQGTAAELFALCDKDGDGTATVRECVDGVSKLNWMAVDDLRELFSSVAQKQKRSGLTSFFSKPKEVLSLSEFHQALVKAGIMGC